MVVRAVAINGSPRMEKGATARLLNAFAGGMNEGGFDVEIIQASQYKIKPCNCGKLYCWNDEPGECCIEDDMQLIYPKLREAEILILATPVYIPLPGALQNVLNRMCPLLDPDLVKRDGRTRARMRDNVSIQKIVLLATSGWWEIENMDTVLRIAREFAEDGSVEFAGALLRPHADFLFRDGGISPEGEAVLDAARRAGFELAEAGAICPETLAEVSAPMVNEEAYWQGGNPG